MDGCATQMTIGFIDNWSSMRLQERMAQVRRRVTHSHTHKCTTSMHILTNAGIVKQSNRVGHSNQRDVSVYCPISRDDRQLQCSNSRRLRFGCFVGMDASVCNKLWKACQGSKVAQELLKNQTGIKGLHVWHCKKYLVTADVGLTVWIMGSGLAVKRRWQSLAP